MRYKLVGKSGLRVSELCLGAMTFGEEWGWGASKEGSKRMYAIVFHMDYSLWWWSSSSHGGYSSGQFTPGLQRGEQSWHYLTPSLTV